MGTFTGHEVVATGLEFRPWTWCVQFPVFSVLCALDVTARACVARGDAPSALCPGLGCGRLFEAAGRFSAVDCRPPAAEGRSTTLEGTGASDAEIRPPSADGRLPSMLNESSSVTGAARSGAGDRQLVERRPSSLRWRDIVDVNATLAKSQLNTIAQEIIVLLQQDPNATVRIVLDIDAQFSDEASEQVRRSVRENASNLKFKTNEWE